MTQSNLNTDTLIRHGFTAGSYCNAYETQSLTDATYRITPSQENYATVAFRQAFILGFFSTYTLDEIGVHEHTYLDAYNSPTGKRCLELGFIEAEAEPEREGE
jgi:hypothetical protein